MKKIFIILTLLILTLNVKIVNAENLICSNYLQYGSTGEQVKILQEELNRTMKCNLDVDGIIGSRTKKCILQFQKKYNIEQDGIVGPITCSKLNKKYNSLQKRNYVVVTGVTSNQVYVRTAPSQLEYTIKGVVNQGEKLRVYDTTTIDGMTWYKTYTSEYGYVYIHGDYVKKTALVLDITNQQLTYFKDGKVLTSVPVITGMKNTNDTPVGKYILDPANKKTNVNLLGQNADGTNYNAFVNYWMPFIQEKGIGFHDASWRQIDDYTKTQYINNGSHGCVNMRPSDAKKLYQSITEKTYVIVK